MAEDFLNTTCCVVGGGPAGVMLGYLLARSGIRVIVLEKHGDFFRDFRGDTVHPSTMEVLYELDLLDDFLRLPHQKVLYAGGAFGDFSFRGPDFRHVPAHSKFTALIPQWDFLNFLSERANRFPTFDLRMSHEATGLMRDGDRITGVMARGPDGIPVHISADLVVGCDGRHSVIRTAGGLPVAEFGVPIDVLWFRISRRPDDPQQVLGTVNFGKALILLDRGEYFQCGMIIRKGGFEELKQQGIEAFHASILQLAPYFGRRTDEVRDWEQVKLLTVQINRLRRWHRPGLLCIGDAAHAMSPAGGVGINLAIQDAVATGNRLARPLLRRSVSDADLAEVQMRREFPTRVTQAAQVSLHNAFARVFARPGPVKAPWQLKAAVRIPGIHLALGYAVGIGIRPEHVRDAERPRESLLCRVAVAIGNSLGRAAAVFGRTPAQTSA
jgi:2-polyprenyl-6-methoxyphenol hydroxylase-like FAD-dependent oxidoreductase